MLRSIRSFLHRFHPQTPARQVRQRFYLEQQELAKDLRQAFRAYERRLSYLERRVVHQSDEELTRDTSLFDASHKALAQVLQRLRSADADVEQLVREWHDWHRGVQAVPSEERRSRLEVLRSELALRGVLPTTEEKTSTPRKEPKLKNKRPTYTPTRLSQDVFQAFDDVYASRLGGAIARGQRLARKLFHPATHAIPSPHTAKRIKHLHALHARWKRVL